MFLLEFWGEFGYVFCVIIWENIDCDLIINEWVY
jgi:hypothetical protein